MNFLRHFKSNRNTSRAYENGYSILRGVREVTSMLVTECLRRNVLMTTIRCGGRFWPLWSPSATFSLYWRRSPTLKRCHQHQQVVTNFQSPTSLSPFVDKNRSFKVFRTTSVVLKRLLVSWLLSLMYHFHNALNSPVLYILDSQKTCFWIGSQRWLQSS